MPGILNSRLAKFYILSSARKKGMPGYLLQHVMKFPLVVPDTEDGPGNVLLKRIARLVAKRCLLSKVCSRSLPGMSRSTDALIADCDKEIDTLVFQLYGLTPGEIVCIENWLQGAGEIAGY